MLEQFFDNSLEQSILITIIEDDSVATQALLTLKSELFHVEVHKELFKILVSINERGLKLEQTIILLELQTKSLEPNFLFDILAKTPTSNFQYFTFQLSELYNKRQLYLMSLKIQEDLKTQTSFAIIKSVNEETDNLTLSGVSVSRAKSYNEWAKFYLDKGEIAKYKTGVSFIDEGLKGGVETGQLILVMGDPEAGKTLMSTQILKNVADDQLSLFFCFEFTVRKFIDNQIQINANYSSDNLLIVNDGYDIRDITLEIILFAKRGGKFALIDSQMRVENSDNGGTVEQSESEKFSVLAKLCHRLDIIILYIAQQGKDDSRSGVHSPMGSKKGGHEASQIWYIETLKKEYDEDGNDINAKKRNFIISKNKQNGVHFKKEIVLDTKVLKFKRPYVHGEKVIEYSEDENSSSSLLIEHQTISKDENFKKIEMPTL